MKEDITGVPSVVCWDVSCGKDADTTLALVAP